MAGSWPLARANIVTQLNGITFDAGASYASETLKALEYPPSSFQTSIIPYCYVIPPARTIRRANGKLRITSFEDGARVHFVLGGAGAELEAVATRMEALAEAIATAFDDALALDGNADFASRQEIGELDTFGPDQHWGFDLTIPLRVSEEKTIGA